MSKLIYLDNAATTAVKPEVFEAMKPYLLEQYANPSSVYSFAQKSAKAVEDARAQIAHVLNAKPGEIYFTGGGSEADNWVLKVVSDLKKEKGKHIITSKIEHHAILHTCEYLEQQGYEVTYLNVDEKGLIDIEELKSAIREDTILISIMFANNEIGTIEPIEEIGQIAKEHGIFFHTDAVQAFGHVPIDVQALHIDALSASGHKFHGPKGVGFLYYRNGNKLKPFIHGGAQEKGKRAGTINTPGIVGMGKAAELAEKDLDKNIAYMTELRDYFIKKIQETIPHCRLNGHESKRLPNNINFCFRFVEGESLLLMLDRHGICGSSGSACTSGSLDPSHVLLAIGLPHEIAHGSLRLTLSEETTKEDLDFVAEKLQEIIARLRSMSPLYEDFLKGEAANV